jgi:hypothetical protein
MSHRLYSLFVPNDSLYTLNLTSEQRQSFCERYNSGDMDLFFDAQSSIELCMLDIWQRFIRSEIWTQHCQEYEMIKNVSETPTEKSLRKAKQLSFILKRK